MKIIAVIVPFSRLSLLKKCISTVTQQSRKPDEIIVINNGSTDGTESWLSQQPLTYYTQENLGEPMDFLQELS
jgi:rhamnopyranosyl-N-acetylglucosaminyl-diphospho-decaprenol beta-1,3/1,4-galactofuranosyltransferase